MTLSLESCGAKIGVEPLMAEADEILKITVASIRTMKGRASGSLRTH